MVSVPIQIDWSVFEKVGIAGVAFGAIYFGYRMVVIFINQWKVSTEAINRNTESFQKLADVVERASKREYEFQKETTELLYEIRDLSRDTNRQAYRIYDTLEKEVRSNELRNS